MTEGQLPIMRAVRLVYRDIVRVARSMPGLALIATAMLLAFNVLDLATSPYLRGSPLGTLLKEVGIRVAEGFLLTPVLIAIHRFILLDQVTGRYAIEPRSPRFERFFVWSLLLWMLGSSVGLLHPLVVGSVSPALSIATLIAAAIAVMFVTLRLTILFPAIAVDAPGASVSNAFADTKGHVFGIFFIFLLAVLPVPAVFAVVAVVLLPAKSIGGEFSAMSIPAAVMMALVQAIIYSLMVAAASRIFQALADKVLRGSP